MAETFVFFFAFVCFALIWFVLVWFALFYLLCFIYFALVSNIILFLLTIIFHLCLQ